jgi:cell pole-organizing protein PopZ
MTERKAENEPSMEEILSSIRRIISEGGDAGEKAAPGSGARPETQEEVLELTDIVQDDGTVVSLADRSKGKGDAKPAAAAPAAPAEETEAVAEPPLPTPPPVKAAAKAPAPAPAPSVAAARADGLISSETAQATAAALANLAASVSHDADAGMQIALGAPGRTLEDIVKDLLRPMIQNWLDANLPAITERLVRREIQRIANRVENE